MQTTAIPKNHMDIPWHEYSGHGNCPITEADLTEKASIVGRVGLMLLSCGTGAWRVRSSMNTISQNLGITCSTDIGLMSIEYTCFDGTSGFSQSLCLTNTGVNTSKLNRLERFIGEFSTVGKTMTGEQLHDHLDEIDRIPRWLWDLPRHWHAAHSHFCLAEDPWKCCLLFAGQDLETLSAAN